MPAIPEPKMPEFSMPAYFELGKRDFTADMITTSVIEDLEKRFKKKIIVKASSSLHQEEYEIA